VKHLRALDADIGLIGAVAARALDEIHSAFYRQAPSASRVWTDGDAILLLARLPPSPDPATEVAPVGAIQRMVSAAVYRRTGVMLRTCGANVHADRGLVVLAFERTATPQDPDPLAPSGAGPVRDSD
jgi:hypothetical protein